MRYRGKDYNRKWSGLMGVSTKLRLLGLLALHLILLQSQNLQGIKKNYVACEQA